MKKKMTFLIAILFTALTVGATDKTWTGGAGDSFFSSAANWSPAGGVASGDALFFANSAALDLVNDFVGYSFSGITASGSASVTFKNTGKGFSLTGDITVSGSGLFNLDVPVTINSNITFMLSGANIYTYAAISGNGSITVEGGKIFNAYAVDLAGGVASNKGMIYIYATTFTAPITLNQLRADNVTYVGMYFRNSGVYHLPITINNSDGSGHAINCLSGTVVTNTAAITIGANAYTRVSPYGTMIYAGGINIQEPARSDMSFIFNGNNIISGLPLAFPNNLYADSGSLRLAVAGNTYASLKCYTHSVFTDVPYALDPDKTVNFGASYTTKGTLDLNGNDQVINRPVLDYTAALNTSDFNLTSSSGAATLACRATGNATFFGRINGALSLSWEPLGAYTFTVTGRISQTTGSLKVNAGTFRLAAGTAFPHLSGLAASGTGTLSVESGDISPGVTLTLADSAQLALPLAISLTCLHAQVDGTFLEAGIYSAASTVGGRTFIAGPGTLTVLGVPLSGTVRTWTQLGNDTNFSNVNNWDAAPLFDGSETFLFAEAGTAAVVDGTFNVGALRFDRSTPFSISQTDETALLRLGAGNVVVLTPAGDAPVTHTLAASLALSSANTFQVGSAQTLAISGPVSGGLPTEPVTKAGAGTLHLTGTNTFESPLVISEGLLMVNNGSALGNPANTITIKRPTSTVNAASQRGPLYFTDMIATNDRPMIIDSAVEYIGQIYPRNGTLVLNGKFTFLNRGRIDNQGTLLFRGGFECLNSAPWMQSLPGFVMRFEKQPLNLGNQQLAIDNLGTMHVCSISNTWGHISLTSSTFLCGAANVIPTNSYASFGRDWTQRGIIDLNGFDQQMQSIRYVVAPRDATNMVVRSATPATLTLQGDSSAQNFAGYFAGAASLRYRNSGGTLAFIYPSSASTTTGDLLIEAGTVAFRKGATWSGSTNITVTAGTLSIEGGQGSTFGGSDRTLNLTALHLTSASSVNLAAGVTEYVNAATLDGERLPVGTYGSLNSAAQYKKTLFTGTGVLHVMRTDAPGTVVLVR